MLGKLRSLKSALRAQRLWQDETALVLQTDLLGVVVAEVELDAVVEVKAVLVVDIFDNPSSSPGHFRHEVDKVRNQNTCMLPTAS